VAGSNEILTPASFLKQLETLHKIDIKKLKQGDTAGFEHLATMMGLQGTTGSMESEVDLLDDGED